jgi:hypothetical protein
LIAAHGWLGLSQQFSNLVWQIMVRETPGLIRSVDENIRTYKRPRPCRSSTDPTAPNAEGCDYYSRDGFYSLSCQILDTSERGVLIRVVDFSSCPNHFVLTPRFDAPRQCEVVWRTGELLGVRYL